MKLKSLLSLLIFICFFKVGFGTHIVGGEIYYDDMGGNNYRVTLKLYRDCLSGGAPYDSIVTIFAYDNAGTFVDSVDLVFPGSVQLPPIINSPCFTPPTGVCVEQAVYLGVINLPPIPGGYNLVFQRCCRNPTIVNIIDPSNVGSTYMVHIPDNSVAPTNFSPRYSYFPPLFICNNIPLSFDHSAIDPDGDSLYYELCDPCTGLDAACPVIGTLAGGGCPIIALPPPYAFVPWESGYSANYPISASANPLAIDPVTGLLTVTPDLIGQYVVGVCVSEYRNGNLLSTVKRDFQFNVVDCSELAVATIPDQTEFCFGLNVNFTQTSSNAVTYNWDFGDPSTTLDVSSLANPTWTYANPGVYTVTLIVSSISGCADTATSVFSIAPLVDADFTPPPGECIYENSFDFAGGGTFSTGSFVWTFGSNASPSSSTSLNPTNVVYNTPGVYPVFFTINENGCSITDTNFIEVYPKPNALYTLGATVACEEQPVHFINASTATPLTYEWDFGDGQTSTLQSPYHLYDTLGSYLTSLIVTSVYGCKDTFNLIDVITVFPSPEAGFSVSPHDTSITYPLVTAVDTSHGVTSSTWYWGDGSSTPGLDSTHSYGYIGGYNIMQVVVNEFGCTDTAYQWVEIYPGFLFWLPNAFTPNGDGLNDFFMPKLFGVHDYSFMIFDRWGEKIFETQNITEGWNGFYKDKKCELGVYVYKISFFDNIDEIVHDYIGGVTLVR